MQDQAMYEYDMQADVQEIYALLDQMKPDYIHIARVLARLESAAIKQALSDAQKTEIEQLRNRAVTFYEEEYNDLYSRAVRDFEDKTLTFAERAERMQPSVDESRFQSSDDYYNTHFYPSIEDRYTELREKVTLLRSDEQWDDEKRKLLLDHIGHYEKRLHEIDTDWLRTTHRLLRSLDARLPRLKKEEERKWMVTLAAHITARESALSVAQDQGLINLALRIPELEDVQAQGVKEIKVEQTGEIVSTGDALLSAKLTYVEACLKHARENLLRATGYTRLDVFDNPDNPLFSDDLELPLSEIHRLLGRAWVLLDPQARQTNRSVSGYITWQAFGEDEQDRPGGESARSQDRTYLPQPDISLLLEREPEWHRLDEIVDLLFTRVSEFDEELDRIERNQYDHSAAARVMVEKILPVYTHDERIYTAWEKVQRDTLDYFESLLSRWSSGYILETVSGDELAEAELALEAHPLRESRDTSASFQHQYEDIKKRLASLVDSWNNTEKLAKAFDNLCDEFRARCKAEEWGKADLYVEEIQQKLKDAFYIRPVNRRIIENELKTYLDNRAAVAGDAEIDTHWQRALDVFEDRILWENVLRLFDAKKYDELSPSSRRGAQCRLAQAQHNYLVSKHASADQDEQLEPEDILKLLKKAQDLLIEVPGKVFDDYPSFLDTKDKVAETADVMTRELSTRSVLAGIVKDLFAPGGAGEQAAELPDIWRYKTVYYQLINEPVDNEDVRKTFIKDFIDNRWKPALHAMMEQAGHLRYIDVIEVRQQVVLLEDDDLWGPGDRTKMRRFTEKLRHRYPELQREPLPDSLFGLALMFDDYALWMDHGRLFANERAVYNDVAAYAVLAFHEPAERAARYDAYTRVKQYVLEKLEDVDSEGASERIDNAGIDGLGVTGDELRRWHEDAHAESRYILYNGLLFAASQMIESVFPDANFDLIKDLQDDMELFIARLRFYPYATLRTVRTIWEYWLTISRLYHVYHTEKSMPAEQLRRMYANYLLGKERAGVLPRNEAYWVNACRFRWDALESRICEVLIEHVKDKLTEQNTPAMLGQYLEYTLMISDLANPKNPNHHDVIESANEWRENNVNQTGIDNAFSYYQHELEDVIYTPAGLRNSLLVSYRIVGELNARLGAIQKSLEKDQMVKEHRLRLNVLEETLRKVQTVNQRLQNSYDAVENLRAQFRQLLDPRQPVIRGIRSSIGAALAQMQSEIVRIADAAPFPDNRPTDYLPLNTADDVPEYATMDALKKYVDDRLDTIDHDLEGFQLFGVDESPRHFQGLYTKISDAVRQRDEIRTYLNERFTRLFPDEEPFVFDIPSDKLETRLESRFSYLLPREYKDSTAAQPKGGIIRGLDDHLKLLESLTQRTREWEKRIQAFNDAIRELNTRAAVVEVWCEHFVRCDAIMRTNWRPSEENGENRYPFPGTLFAGMIIDALAIEAVQQQRDRESVPGFSDIRYQVIQDYDEAWDKCQNILDELSESSVTADVVDLFNGGMIETLGALRDALKTKDNYLRASHRQRAEREIYREVIFREQSRSLAAYAQQFTDLISAIRDKRVTDDLLQELITVVHDSLNLLYGNMETYVEQRYQAYQGYIKELKEEISFREDPPDTRGFFDRLTGKKKPELSRSTREDIQKWNDIIAFLQRFPPSSQGV